MYKQVQEKSGTPEHKKYDTQALVHQDINSLGLMYCHARCETLLLIASMPITIPIGYLLNKHFTVYALAFFNNEEQVYISSYAKPHLVDEEKKCESSYLKENHPEALACQAIIEYGKTSYTSSIAERSWYEKLVRIFIELVQHGYMLKKRPWLVKKWVHIKLKTEKRMYESLPTLNLHNPIFPGFSEYICVIGGFAMSWANCKGILKLSRISDALNQLSITADVDLSEVEKHKGISDWKNVLGFFYTHGN